MIKVVMRDSEDLLIDGNHISHIAGEYRIINKFFNGLFSQERTVAVVKVKDVKMIYEIKDNEVAE